MAITHTFAELEVPSELYDLVAQKLETAGYLHAIEGGVIDMHGIALVRESHDIPGQGSLFSARPT
jgi:hypothetical protein